MLLVDGAVSDIGGSGINVVEGQLNVGATGGLSNVGTLRIGYHTSTTTPLVTTGIPTVTVAAGGSLSFVSGGNIYIGNRSTIDPDGWVEGKLDLSALTNFTATVGTLALGYDTGLANNSGHYVRGTLLLPTNSNINATSQVIVGYGPFAPTTGTFDPSTITFGSGTSTLTTPTMSVGRTSLQGRVDILAGGTLNLTADTLYLGYSGGYSSTGVINMTNGTLIATLGEVRLSYRTINANNTGSTGTLTLGTSALNDVDITTLYVGSNSGGSSSHVTGNTGTLNMAGGSLTVGTLYVAQQGADIFTTGTVNLTGGSTSVTTDMYVGDRSHGTSTRATTGTVNVSGASTTLSVGGDLWLAYRTAATSGTAASNGTLTLNGGTTTVTGNIRTVDIANANATLTLEGGILDMTAGTINVDTFNARAGTLQNVVGIWNQAGPDGLTPLTVNKTTSGTLTLAESNTWTGATNVNAGTLRVNGTLGGTSGVAVNTGGTLGGTGTINSAANVNAGGTLAPGNSIGTLTLGTANLTLNATSISDFEISAETGLAHDLVAGIDALSYDGTLRITTTAGTLAAGQSWDLFNFASQSGQFANHTVFGTDGSVGDKRICPCSPAG